MHRAVALASCMPLVACLQGSSGSGGGEPAASGSATGASVASSDLGGTDCVEQAGGTLLCEQISTCPGVVVDPGALPSCGFRLGGLSSLDLECDCSGYLCPIGAPQTCADAMQLLQGQDALEVCEQASEGRCLLIVVDAGAPSGASPGCNQQCQSECAGNPDCYQACGC